MTKKVYFEIHNINKIRHLLPTEITELIASTLVLSKLDYCNLLFFGTTKEMLKKLQIAQNSTARLICKKREMGHGGTTLVMCRKIMMDKILTSNKSLDGNPPCYLQNFLSIYNSKHSLRSSSEPN